MGQLTKNEKVFPVALDDSSKLVSAHLKVKSMVEYRHLIRCGQFVCNAYLQAETVVIHLVNYNRVESEDGSPANESSYI